MGYNWCELDLRKQLVCCIRAGSDHSLSAMNSGTWGPKCRYNLHCWADNIVVTMGGGIANEDNHDDDHEDRSYWENMGNISQSCKHEI